MSLCELYVIHSVKQLKGDMAGVTKKKKKEDDMAVIWVLPNDQRPVSFTGVCKQKDCFSIWFWSKGFSKLEERIQTCIFTPITVSRKSSYHINR